MTDRQSIDHAHQVFEEGKQAALNGKQVTDNPHPPGSDDHEHWRKGFDFVEKFDEDGEVPSDL